jgi:hypothetical protein
MPRQTVVSAFVSRAIEKYHQKYTPDSFVRVLKGQPASGRLFLPFWCHFHQLSEALPFETRPIKGMCRFVKETHPFNESGLRHPDRYVRGHQVQMLTFRAACRFMFRQSNLTQKFKLWLQHKLLGLSWFHLERLRRVNPEYISKPVVMAHLAPSPRRFLPAILGYSRRVQSLAKYSALRSHPHWQSFVRNIVSGHLVIYPSALFRNLSFRISECR